MKTPQPKHKAGQIQLGTRSVKLTRPGSNPVRDSDRRIQKAMEGLASSHRGQSVLDDLAMLFNGEAKGLDLSGQSCLVTLVREFAFGHRRGFITTKQPAKKTAWQNAEEGFAGAASSRIKGPPEDAEKYQVIRNGRDYRQVMATDAGKACDIVRADDANAGEYLPVESYTAYPI